jgi:hypothetical protein
MTPTLMDVVMIAGLDIASSSPSGHGLPEVPFRLSSNSECTNWGVYLNHHVKTKGLVTEKEHTTFLNFFGWNTSYFAVLPLPQPKITFL